MWDVKGCPFIRHQSWEKDIFPFSDVPGLRATEVEAGGAKPLKSPLWALLWACPLEKQGAFCWYRRLGYQPRLECCSSSRSQEGTGCPSRLSSFDRSKLWFRKKSIRKRRD